MDNNHDLPPPVDSEEEEAKLMSRRDFLHSLNKWSRAVIGGVLLGGFLAPSEAKAQWVNRRGGWINGSGGGGSWVNRSGGGGWINRGGGGGWVNRGGGSWVNRRG